MIAIDTCSLIHYLGGSRGDDVEAVAQALSLGTAVLPPVVLSEILSDAALPDAIGDLVTAIPLLPLTDDYWRRAGLLRSIVTRAGRKARLADCLVAQSCIDSNVTLITRDPDFSAFVGRGLRLAIRPRRA
jgi:predicted nucleic acid-binding protein